MKIILEFDSEEELEDARTALDGENYKLAFWDLDQWLRAEIKYSNLSEDAYETFEKCREKLREILYERNLKLD